MDQRGNFSTASSAPGLYSFTALGVRYTFARPGDVRVGLGLRGTRMLHGPNGARLRLVTWDRDDGGCTYQYGPFAVEPAGTLRPVRSNYYDWRPLAFTSRTHDGSSARERTSHSKAATAHVEAPRALAMTLTPQRRGVGRACAISARHARQCRRRAPAR